MIKYPYKALKNYYSEVQAINLNDFNQFILRKLLMNSVKINTILPFIIAIVVVLFSFIIQQNIYVFLPQSSITSFASYMVFTGAISLLVLILYPLLIILLLNYIGEKIRATLKKMFLITKLVILTSAFYACTFMLTNGWLTLYQQFYVTCLWLGLYFFLINLYLAYLHNNNILKITRFRLLFVIIFASLLAKPYLFMFLHTSEMIDYTSVDPYIYLSPTNCKLISNPIHTELDNPQNLTINDNNSVQKQPDGSCYIRWGSIRYGFGGDYVIIFKKNIKPLKRHGKVYNDYVRLNCYAGNCYADDEKFVLWEKDLSGDLIEKTKTYRMN